MKKQHQSNLLPQELKKFEVLKESKLEQVTGGDVRHRSNNLIWRDLFFKRK